MPDLAQCLSTKCARSARCARHKDGGERPSEFVRLVGSEHWSRNGDRCSWFWEAEVEVSDARRQSPN